MILLRHSGETCAAMGDSTFVFPAASDGYWLMLNPLPPGLHTINFRWDQQDYGFQIAITYSIMVVPRDNSDEPKWIGPLAIYKFVPGGPPDFSAPRATQPTALGTPLRLFQASSRQMGNGPERRGQSRTTPPQISWLVAHTCLLLANVTRNNDLHGPRHLH